MLLRRSASALTIVERGLEVRASPYWAHPPSEPQFVFLSLPQEEALYGGAAGGGKSDALLMAALQYVDVPGYAAIIIRRTFAMLNQPDALIPRSHEWLGNTDARWNAQDHQWRFPSGAILKFGYLDTLRDRENYQGAAYHFMGWDELTQFPEEQYRWVSFSRTRKPVELRVPIRVRTASNPGGVGHEWVKGRFGLYRPEGEPETAPLMCHRSSWPHRERIFIPAHVRDNPGLDVEDYTRRMSENLDQHSRAQLLDGSWDSRPPGDLFRRDWFEIVDEIPDGCRWVRYWDLAATEPSESNPDPDWTVGLRLGTHPNGTRYVEHVERLRRRPQGVERAVEAMAARDGIGTPVWIEQEPGSAGKNTIDQYSRVTLPQHAVDGHRSTGSKFERAQPVSSKAERGLIKLKRGPWNAAFLDEVEAFTETDDHAHDDQVDALSGAFAVSGRTGEVKRVPYMPPGGEVVVRHGDLTLRGRQYIDKE